MDYYSRKKLIEIYKASKKTYNLSFDTFYNRVHSMGWSIEKSLSYPVKPLKLKYRRSDIFLADQIELDVEIVA